MGIRWASRKKISFFLSKFKCILIIYFKGGFGGCNDEMVQSQAVASTGFDSCTIQSTGASCGGVSQVEVLISYSLSTKFWFRCPKYLSLEEISNLQENQNRIVRVKFDPKKLLNLKKISNLKTF